MATLCPNGHQSETTEFCSICGIAMPVETSIEGHLDRCPNCGSPPRSLTVCANCAYSLIARDVVPPWEHQRWEIVVRPDREYFDTLEHEDVEFPEGRASRRIELVGDHVSIGRRSKRMAVNPEVDLSGGLEDDGVSRRHAVLMRQPEGHWALIDQDSANGTLLGVDQDPIPPNHPFPLSDGDSAYVGYWTKLSIERFERDETPQLDVESRPSQDTRNIARRRRLFEIDLLGPLQLRVRGDDIPIGAAQVRAVLTLLALRIGTPVSVSDIEWALWGDDEPRAARQAIRTTLRSCAAPSRTLQSKQRNRAATGSWDPRARSTCSGSNRCARAGNRCSRRATRVRRWPSSHAPSTCGRESRCWTWPTDRWARPRSSASWSEKRARRKTSSRAASSSAATMTSSPTS